MIRLPDYNIPAFSHEAENRSREIWDDIAKPLKGLGAFEDILSRICGMQDDVRADISKRICVIMCADNGIVSRGVAQAPSAVTRQVADSMSRGLSCVCLMAAHAGIDTLPVDTGIACADDIEEYDVLTPAIDHHYKLLDRCIARSTKDFLKEPAMSEDEFLKALDTGVQLAAQLYDAGYKLICTGELGIGNTTTSAAVASSILRLDPALVTGRGSGLDDASFMRKKEVISEAISKYSLFDREASDIVRYVGGFDIASLMGIFIGGAMHRIPVVIDGVITASAALAVSRLVPEAVSYMIPSHQGQEQAMGYIYKDLGFEPVIHAKLKLGEGTGAVSLIPMLDMAKEVYDKMARFDDLSIERYVDHGSKDSAADSVADSVADSTADSETDGAADSVSDSMGGSS